MQFRFSIRDLLLVTTIVALAAGWWFDHRRLVKNAAIESLLSKDATMVQLRWQISDWEFARSLQPSSGTAAINSFNARITDLQNQLDQRHDELLRSLQ